MRVLSCFVATAVLAASSGLSAQGIPKAPGSASDPSPVHATRVAVASVLLGAAAIPMTGVTDPPLQGVVAGLAVTAFIVGPSTGYLYAGMTGRGIRSAALRAACGGLMVFGAVHSDINVFDEDSGNVAAIMLVVVSAAVGVGLAIDDIISVGPDVRAGNATRVAVGYLGGGDVGVRITPGLRATNSPLRQRAPQHIRGPTG